MKLTDTLPEDQRERVVEERFLRSHPLLNASPRAIEQWIDRNVDSLEDVREALKVIAKIAILKP